MASSNKKIAEAKDHITAAEKCLKTSFMKWKPDNDGAASEYSKAATCYKNAKALPECRSAHKEAAKCHLQCGTKFQAAKSYEQAGMISKDMKEWTEAASLIEHAAQLYQEHGTPDTAALMLEKAGKMLETERPARAVELYKQACDVAELEDRPRQCAESLGKAARLLVKLSRYEEALVILRREIECYVQVEAVDMIFKRALAVVLIHLQIGDYVAADQFFKSCTGYAGFASCEEGEVLDELLTAYDEGDDDRVVAALRLPVFTYLDNEYAKLARSMRTSSGSGDKTKKVTKALDDLDLDDDDAANDLESLR